MRREILGAAAALGVSVAGVEGVEAYNNAQFEEVRQMPKEAKETKAQEIFAELKKIEAGLEKAKDAGNEAVADYFESQNKRLAEWVLGPERLAWEGSGGAEPIRSAFVDVLQVVVDNSIAGNNKLEDAAEQANVLKIDLLEKRK